MTVEMLDAIEVHHNCSYDGDSYFFVEEFLVEANQDVEKFVGVRNQ